MNFFYKTIRNLQKYWTIFVPELNVNWHIDFPSRVREYASSNATSSPDNTWLLLWIIAEDRAYQNIGIAVQINQGFLQRRVPDTIESPGNSGTQGKSTASTSETREKRLPTSRVLSR